MPDEPRNHRSERSRDQYGQLPPRDPPPRPAPNGWDDDAVPRRRAPDDNYGPRSPHVEGRRPRDEQQRPPDRRPARRDDQERGPSSHYRDKDNDYDRVREQRSERYDNVRGDESLPFSRSDAAPRYRDDRSAPMRGPRRPYLDDDDDASFPRRPSARFSRSMGRIGAALSESMQVVAAPSRRVGRRLLARFAALTRWQRVAVVALLLMSCVGSSVFTALSGIQQYNEIKSVGNDGVHEMFAIKDLLSQTGKGQGIQEKAKEILQAPILSQVQRHSDSALRDFQQLNTIFAEHQGLIGIAGQAPPLTSKVDAIEHLAQVGIDVAQLGKDFATNGAALAPIFATSLFASDGPPILTSATYDVLQRLISAIRMKVDDIASQLARVNLNDLPLNSSQRDQLSGIKGQIPGIVQTLNSWVPNLPMLHWALGVDAPRLFLVQTMDRGELRPTGGFNGQFGTLSLTGARLGKISLTDVSNIDYLGKNENRSVPDPYKSWWPYSVWGLRDANLSGDFPTSAKFAVDSFAIESGTKTDGVISFSVVVIEHLLAIDGIGPIQVTCYGDLVTAQNLEERIHYYQLGGGTTKDYQCQHLAGTTSIRKGFTATLSSLLQEKIRTLPTEKLGTIFASIGQDFHAKNIQIYLGDPQAEAVLTKDGLAASMNRDPKIDGTFIVQTNIGANKGNTYVTTKVVENITLNASGDAHHDLSVSMYYNPGKNSVYGWDAVRDYIRVYVPENAHYDGGSGFDETKAQPLCYSICTPKKAPICDKTPSNPTGAFDPGTIPPSFARTQGGGRDPNGAGSYTDDIGEPNNQQSDEPGRAMFAGLIIMPKACTALWTLQWDVPHSAGTAAQQNVPYTFIAQNQSGTNDDLTVSITPSQGVTTPPIHAHITSHLSDLTWALGASQ